MYCRVALVNNDISSIYGKLFLLSAYIDDNASDCLLDEDDETAPNDDIANEGAAPPLMTVILRSCMFDILCGRFNVAV